MAGLCRCFGKTILSALVVSLIVVSRVSSQSPATTESRPDFGFWAVPEPQLVAQGEPVSIKVSIYNGSDKPIFVSRLNRDELLNFKVVGPDGKETFWQGKATAAPAPYVPADFTSLAAYHEFSAKKIISLKGGTGFDLDRPGQYSVTTEYSPPSREQLAPFAGSAIIPAASLRSARAAFCVEVCVVSPLPRAIQVQSNGSPAAVGVVRDLYTAILKYHPLGVPHPKRVFWPLLSNRLAAELDSVDSCNADYFRRFGKILRKYHYKPAPIWFEDGPLTGPDDAATPAKFTILSSRAIGEDRVDVHLKFKSEEVNPGNSFDFEGIATVIRQNDRWLIDDFVSLQGNDELARLSDDIPRCKDGKWVGTHY